MQEETKEQTGEKGQISNRKVADSGGKLIFENPTLCSQLLKTYSGLEILKNIKPEDIEDVTERFIPMFTDERDADVVKMVHLPNGEDIFIALIEHKASLDYNVSMQILRYMVFIWEYYAKRMDMEHKGISRTKRFRYPPILPIVYYEGKEKWEVEKEFREKIALNDIFSAFIPVITISLLDSFVAVLQ